MTMTPRRRLAVPKRGILTMFFDPERIKRMRDASGLSQQEVAYHLGLTSHMAISNWEVGRKPPGPRSLHDLWRWYQDLVIAGQYPDEYESWKNWTTRSKLQPSWQEFGDT